MADEQKEPQDFENEYFKFKITDNVSPEDKEKIKKAIHVFNDLSFRIKLDVIQVMDKLIRSDMMKDPIESMKVLIERKIKQSFVDEIEESSAPNPLMAFFQAFKRNSEEDLSSEEDSKIDELLKKAGIKPPKDEEE